MRRAAKPDANKAEIVAVVRKMGASWLDIIPVNGDEPDGILGVAGQDRLCEIKMPGKTLSKDQRDWHAAWRGRAPVVIESVEQAVDIVTFFRGRLTRAK